MKRVIIVGGGIAGLTAGIYARQSGLDAVIYEMHSIPGGNSTSWRRGGYLFEGGMHWLTGSNPKAPLHRLWREVGALRDDTLIYNRDPFLTYMDAGGPICLHRDPAKLEQHLLSVAPGDAEAIRALVRDIRVLGALSMPVSDIKGVRLKHKSRTPLSMLPGLMRALPRMRALEAMTAGAYADRFSHPGIRALLKQVVGREDYAASATLFTLAGLAAGDGGYPEGGSLRMAQNMTDAFTSLGGILRYNTRIQQVCVEDGRTRGVMLDGELREADAVIVASDTMTAIDALFDAPLNESWTGDMRAQLQPLNCTFICLGVRADLRDVPENPLYTLERPIEFGGISQRTLGFNNYAHFNGYAPEGCTALTTTLMGDTYDAWKQARADGSYAREKQALAETVIDRLEHALPQTKGCVEVWDIATPLTYERYCGTYRGSWMSVMTPGKQRRQYPCKSESICGLYFAGQRIMVPGGLPVALTSGRQAVQYLCADEDIVFQGRG